jgi:hypothetical protein
MRSDRNTTALHHFPLLYAKTMESSTALSEAIAAVHALWPSSQSAIKSQRVLMAASDAEPRAIRWNV